ERVRLQSIELREFRNHKEARFDLRGDSALVLGENGSGKTNLLEAVVLLSIGKSFRGSRDPALLCRGASSFEVRGAVRDGRGVESEIVARGADGPKEVLVDGAGHLRARGSGFGSRASVPGRVRGFRSYGRGGSAGSDGASLARALARPAHGLDDARTASRAPGMHDRRRRADGRSVAGLFEALL